MCAQVTGSTIATIDHRYGLIYIIIPPTSHSSLFYLLPSSSTPPLLYSTILYSTASQTTASQHLLRPVPYFVHLSLLICSSVPPPYSLYRYCLVHPIRLYSSVRLFLAIKESFPCDIYSPSRLYLLHQPYQPNLTARYLASRRSHHDPNYDPTIESQTTSFSASASAHSHTTTQGRE